LGTGIFDEPLAGKSFRRFSNFVYESQEELAVQVFERAMPDSYGILIEDLVPESMYAKKTF
jgi:hypothetical protein